MPDVGASVALARLEVKGIPFNLGRSHGSEAELFSQGGGGLEVAERVEWLEAARHGFTK